MKVERNGLFDIEIDGESYHFHLQSDADTTIKLLEKIGVELE